MVDDDDAGWHKRRDKRMDDSDRGKVYQARRHSTLVAVHQLATTRLVASSSRSSNDDEMAGVLHGATGAGSPTRCSERSLGEQIRAIEMLGRLGDGGEIFG
ncbi:MAG: hypothetical protein LQ341_001643 [Variospora aurantia]|nr:MAG: hypothetical protein LQ341_001643 [Variospora aurantia]